MAEMLGLMTNRLTPEQLAQIRERANHALDLNPFDSLRYFELSAKIYREDIPMLLAEIERLNKRLEQAKEILDLDTVILDRIFGKEDAHDPN